ncbi:hypothetical protein HCK00_14885 [Streptomyces sp. PLAI1-29]|uniref:Lipoprotein n=1 Tax=Streptomyces zingiberis TaxID=2053010 RepID=A0ABX1C1L2_9ACTN|nr:hypothetical protein [Streptomyces zingiberis]
MRPAVLALAGVAAAMTLSACSVRDAICSDGEYPVHSIGGTGRACVSEDEEPPKEYVRYPEGKTPKMVDDKWDIYWRTHTLDKDGNISKAPEDE